MSNLISVPRDLAVDLLDGLRITQERARKELRALLAKPESASGKLPPIGRQAMWRAIDEALTGTVEPMLRGDICNILAALLVPAAQPQGKAVAARVCAYTPGMGQVELKLPDNLPSWLELGETVTVLHGHAQPQGEPVYMVRTHGSCCWEEVGSGSLEDFQSMPEEYELRALYTRPAEQPEPISSTSDKYKAELYDEVWQLARDMGFGNVIDALMKLNKQTAPVAVVLPERIDESICRGHSLTLAIKWNRCLDEVARLNPPQQ